MNKNHAGPASLRKGHSENTTVSPIKSDVISKINTQKKDVPIMQPSLDNENRLKVVRDGPPKFKLLKKNTVGPIEKDPEKNLIQMKEATGSSDVDFIRGLLNQVSATFQSESAEQRANFNVALMHGLNPKDEIEGVLITQMVGTHNLIMEFMKRAMIPGQYLEAGNDYTSRALKLMSLYLRQVDTLEKHRGKLSEQKVIVEHVHIHEGGKAIVGHFESKTQGEGENKKNGT